MDDATIIHSSKSQPAMFGAIFERHYDDISRFARRRVGETAGEEVAATTFLVAFEHRGRFEPGSRSALPWLFGIATNLIRRRARDERVHLRALARLPVEAATSPDVDDPDRLDALGLRSLLVTAIAELNQGDRDAFLLFALAGQRYEDIGIALGIPTGTVRSRIHRVRSILRERIGPEVAITSEMNDVDDREVTDGRP